MRFFLTFVDIKLKNTDVQEAADPLFYLRTKCETESGSEGAPDSELACVDNDGATNETYSLPLADKSPPIFLFADVGDGQSGPFELTLTPSEPPAHLAYFQSVSAGVNNSEMIREQPALLSSWRRGARG